MAITSGVGAHSAWLIVDGTRLLVQSGSVTQNGLNRTSAFRCALPMSEPGAYPTLAKLGDNRTTIEVMTRGVTKTMLTGETNVVDYDFIGRMIHVEGRDVSAKLHDGKTSDKWVNKKTTDIVRELAGRAGLKVDISGEAAIAGKMLEADHVKLSDGVSFSYLINKLAEIDGARWWVDADGVLHYAKFGSTVGGYSIYVDQTSQPIRSDCLHLRIRDDIEIAKGSETEFSSWHPRQKKVNRHTVKMPGRGTPKRYEYTAPNLRQDQTETYARSFANERAHCELTVRATIVGDPSIAAGMGLSLTGTGDFDQPYEIDHVHHDFGMRGHTTHITARSARKGRTAT